MRAQQHGNGSYEAAADSVQSFTVTSGGSGGSGSSAVYRDYIRLGSRVIAVQTQTTTGGGPILAASPSSGTYSSGTFTFTNSNATGVSGVSVLINSTASGSSACWMYFDGTTLSLAEDDGVNWSSATLSNSQCTITSPTAITNTGSDKAFTTTITFTPSFAGSRDIYMYGASGYQSVGTITVSGSDVPSLTATIPSPGSGMSGTFTFKASDASTVTAMTVLINSSFDGTNAAGSTPTAIRFRSRKTTERTGAAR